MFQEASDKTQLDRTLSATGPLTNSTNACKTKTYMTSIYLVTIDIKPNPPLWICLLFCSSPSGTPGFRGAEWSYNQDQLKTDVGTILKLTKIVDFGHQQTMSELNGYSPSPYRFIHKRT